MCFKQGDESHPKPKKVKRGLVQIGVSIYVKDVDKLIIQEAATIQSEVAEMI